MTYKWLLFDMDGTLLDSAGCIRKAVSYGFDAVGFSSQKHQQIPSDGSIALEDFYRMAGVPNPQKAAACAYEYFRKHQEEFILFDGIVEVIPKLAEKAEIALATNREYESARMILEQFGLLEYFSSIQTPSQGAAKPSSELWERIILDMLPYPVPSKNNILMIGDSSIDMEFAQNIGIHKAWVSWGPFEEYPAERISCEHILSQPEELLNLV